jgi:hypothetical protein
MVVAKTGEDTNNNNLEVSFFSEAQHCNIVKYCFNEHWSNEIFTKSRFTFRSHQFTRCVCVKRFYFNECHCDKNTSLMQYKFIQL